MANIHFVHDPMPKLETGWLRRIASIVSQFKSSDICHNSSPDSGVTDRIPGQGGFTLVELLASVGILATLVGVVAASLTGVGGNAQMKRLIADQIALDMAADRFAVESFPGSSPVVSLEKSPDFLKPSSDLGVRLIDFDSPVSQNPTTTFVPHFIKEIPDTAVLVSWRIDTTTGGVFFARDDAKLVRPAASRLNTSAADTRPGGASDYTFELVMKKGQAGTKFLIIDIPVGYRLGEQIVAEGTKIGRLTIKHSPDNVWKPGRTFEVGADLVTTRSPTEWKLVVDYSAGSPIGDESTVRGGVTRVHLIRTVPPTADLPGSLTLTIDRGDDPDENEATETWRLKLFGTLDLVSQRSNFITNPSVPGVYRWLVKEHTTIDIDGFYDIVAGNQAVFVGLHGEQTSTHELRAHVFADTMRE